MLLIFSFVFFFLHPAAAQLVYANVPMRNVLMKISRTWSFALLETRKASPEYNEHIFLFVCRKFIIWLWLLTWTCFYRLIHFTHNIIFVSISAVSSGGQFEKGMNVIVIVRDLKNCNCVSQSLLHQVELHSDSWSSHSTTIQAPHNRSISFEWIYTNSTTIYAMSRGF